MIALHSISKGFQGKQVLKEISFEVEDGDRLCIIGKSGSGKSVLLKLMTGLLQPDSGNVIIGNQVVTNFGVHAWNELLIEFGVVFQSAALFDSLTVQENVGIRMFEERKLRPAEIVEKVALALEMVGLNPSEVMLKFPAELSGGMQKRVGIARAIINRPKYLLYDEPTTGLDPVNAGLIDDLMAKLAQDTGRTSVIVTHDMYTVKTIATKVAFIEDMRLHFFGTPKEMFASQDATIQGFLSRTI